MCANKIYQETLRRSPTPLTSESTCGCNLPVQSTCPESPRRFPPRACPIHPSLSFFRLHHLHWDLSGLFQDFTPIGIPSCRLLPPEWYRNGLPSSSPCVTQPLRLQILVHLPCLPRLSSQLHLYDQYSRHPISFPNHYFLSCKTVKGTDNLEKGLKPHILVAWELSRRRIEAFQLHA